MNGDPPIEDPRQAVWNEMMDKMHALEAERDALRAEVEKLKGLALSASMDAAELSEELAARSENVLQVYFNGVVHVMCCEDPCVILSADALMDQFCRATTKSQEYDLFYRFAKSHHLSTAVLDELWPEE